MNSKFGLKYSIHISLLLILFINIAISEQANQKMSQKMRASQNNNKSLHKSQSQISKLRPTSSESMKNDSINSKNDFVTQFEKSKGLETATYAQVIDYYKKLAFHYESITVHQMGPTDASLPLHMVIFNKDKEPDLDQIRKQKSIVLINNGIHPGESDGIDATMMLLRDLAEGKLTAPNNVAIAVIPIYNIGGSLNRNSTTRTNQNGPKSYGFRGNARNYDLNRDFIKSDTLNSQSFAQLFHLVKPDVFIDNHVSNGADYQYTLTHLFTQHNKLGGKAGIYLNEVLMPRLEKKLSQHQWDMTPYVNVFNQPPEKGFQQFMDYPRYSTGYTSLFNVLGMMVETHMLKPYEKRVLGTYQLMASMLEIVDAQSAEIKSLRKEQLLNLYNQKHYTLDWEIDQEKSTTLNFKGYEASTIDSDVTNAKRLKFDQDKPFTKPVEYQNYYKPKLNIVVPEAYIIPKGWHNIIKLLKMNNVEMTLLDQPTKMEVEAIKIVKFDTKNRPYEGHYLHSNTQIEVLKKNIMFDKGDFVIKVRQPSIRYIIETLEPQAPDSFFNWNFFDSILQQKEGFSPYVFEDIAHQFLLDNPNIATTFQQKLKNDDEFKSNWYAQLDWIHKQSPHYETSHNHYPVYRLIH